MGLGLLPTLGKTLPPDERLVLKAGSESFLRANFEVQDVVIDFSPSLQASEGAKEAEERGEVRGTRKEERAQSPGSGNKDGRSKGDGSPDLKRQGAALSAKPGDGLSKPSGVKNGTVPTVELLPAEEIFLQIPENTPAGQALVLAVGSDRLKAFDICISHHDGQDCPRPPADESWSKACPKVKEVLDDGKRITAGDIESVTCLDALKAGLAHSYDPPSSFRFILHEVPATVFYQRVLEKIRNDPKTQGLSASYFGATLVLKGKVSRAAISRALLHAYRETVGSVSYDDRSTRP